MNARFWAIALVFATGVFGNFSARAAEDAVLLSIEGDVTVRKTGTQNWQPAQTNQMLKAGDRVRTGDNGRAMARLGNNCIQRVPPNSTYDVEARADGQPGVNVKQGGMFLFIRDLFGGSPARSDFAAAATRGTEFHVFVEADGRTVFTVIDGEVDVTNGLGTQTLRANQQAEVKPGGKPERTAMLDATSVIQWCLYYPAVLDPAELSFTAAEKQQFGESLAAYAQGDLRRAFQIYHASAAPSEVERTYAAALWLAFAEVPQSQKLLDGLQTPAANALRRLAAIVQNRAATNGPKPSTASEWMAESYYFQSKSKLDEALAAAREAKKLSPNFAFAWTRMAELEFSFGHTATARDALEMALEMAPWNAQGWALQGFVHAAENKHREALRDFENAVELDGMLPTAWLGRGLIKIRLGHSADGRRDLQAAAALQPTFAIFRSYLGKAIAEDGNLKLAEKDLALAQRLDPQDPTAWLYSALLKQSENRINEAVRDLEHSVELNDNRSVYRSALLLDQDRAVRSANLANIYLDAGMLDVSVREAVRAVNYDYANYSAHLFLANSYDRLRDPKQINLRYETPWFSEYLIANLLAPVGAGTLSQNVSQQEYSKLFERDGFGAVSSTEYFSNGDWVQNAAHYGRFGNSAYAVDIGYRSDNGQRPNNDFEQTTVSLQLKQQLTAADSVYLQVIGYDSEAGDVAQYYQQSQASRRGRSTETQEPIVIAGYHHEWTPGVHTLLLASRADDTFKYRTPNSAFLFLQKDSGGDTQFADALGGLTNRYRSQLEIYSVELQQIFQQPKHTTILGARYQNGDFETRSRQSLNDALSFRGIFPDNPIAVDNIEPGFERVSVYGYHHWSLHRTLLLVGGVSYDHLEFPRNYRFAPLRRGEDENDQISPKGGIIWTPLKGSTVRAGYTRSLGGVSFDQSFRLEPTQVAGFNQAFRSIIPESIAAANANADFETYGLSLEQKFPTATYVGLSLESLNSEVRRTVGVFQTINLPPASRGGARERLDYEERTLVVTLNQLLGDEWALGTRYQLSRANLDDRYTSITGPASSSTGFRPRTETDGLLHELSLFAIYNHPSGFFTRGEAVWRSQDNDGYTPHREGDDFWQLHIFAGYRFWRRHAEVQVGVLNLTDQDYRLNPLNLYYEAPRERTFAARLQFNF
jgi:Tfp pilus assembly protein PilF